MLKIILFTIFIEKHKKHDPQTQFSAIFSIFLNELKEDLGQVM